MRMSNLPIFATLEQGCIGTNLKLPVRNALGVWLLADDVHGGRHGRGVGRVKKFADGKGAICWNWRTGQVALVLYDYNGRKPSREELRKMKAELRKQRAQYERETAERQKAVSLLAVSILDATESPADGHEYLSRKGLVVEHPWRGLRCISADRAQDLINRAAIRQEDDIGQVLSGSGRLLVIPLTDATGAVWSLQFIDEAGRKTFLKGGRKKGLLWCPDGLAFDAGLDGVIGIAEGVATAMSVTALYAVPCVAAIDAGNLLPAAETLRKAFPKHSLTFYADKDISRVGEEKAKEAARLLIAQGAQCRVLLPVFDDDMTAAFAQRTGKVPTDFNDLWVYEFHGDVDE